MEIRGATDIRVVVMEIIMVIMEAIMEIMDLVMVRIIPFRVVIMDTMDLVTVHPDIMALGMAQDTVLDTDLDTDQGMMDPVMEEAGVARGIGTGDMAMGVGNHRKVLSDQKVDQGISNCM